MKPQNRSLVVALALFASLGAVACGGSNAASGESAKDLWEIGQLEEQLNAKDYDAVADFYADVMHRLDLLGVTAQINPLPQELPAPIPFDQDTIHASYDPDAARRWWQIMTSAATVMWRQRSWFVGKASPVHFFWGSFDLTATRHNGEPAPPHPERGYIYRVAENEANWAAGFWPGSGAVDYPAFYAYMVPQPDGMPAAAIAPGAAFWHEEMREFLLPYDAVRTEADPEATLMAFLQSSYAACADLAEWNRAALEITEIPRPR